MPLTVVENFMDYPVGWTSIVFTQPGPREGGTEAEADVLCRILSEGAADIVHLRKPEASRSYVEETLRHIPDGFLSKVVLHDFYDLAEKFNLGGIQLNSRNKVPDNFGGRRSASCHSLKEVCEMAPRTDYVTLSPVFDSISKYGYASAFSPEELKNNLPKGKVMALGGVTPDDLPRLHRAGFAGSAVLGWLWQEPLAERMKALALRVRMLRAFPLLLITDGSDVGDTVRQACDAYRGGCRWAQVRMKEATTAERAEAASLIMQRCPGMLVCVDDDCEAVAMSGAHGVHLGKNDISTAQARKIIGDAAVVGRTANTFADVEAMASERGADYFGIGPLRFTTTKRNLASSLGYGGYSHIITEMRRQDIHVPVLAIGGVTTDDVKPLLKTGVDGVAVSGSINHAPDPSEATEEFLVELKKYRD